MSCPVVAALSGWRLLVTTEREVQRQIAERFEAAGLAFEREVPVTGGRIDFLVGDIGVEVKISGGRRAIWRQIKGYASEPRITRFVLVASNACPMPPDVGGKSIIVHQLGAAWL